MNINSRIPLPMTDPISVRNKIHRLIYLTLFCVVFCFPSVAQNFEWAKKMGGTWIDQGESIVVDDQCNVYSTGGFNGTANFNGVTINAPNSQNSEVYVQKMDPNGNLIWVVSVGGTYQDLGQSITLDNAGNIYIIGRFLGTVDFNPDPSGVYNLTSSGGATHYNTFILKLSSAGNFIWAKNNESNWAFSVKTDAAGNVYTAGNFAGTRNFNPGGSNAILTTQAYKFYVEKLGPNGNFLWAKTSANSGYNYGNSMSLDPFGNILVTGKFKGTVDFDPGVGNTNTSSISSNSDCFVLKWNSNGDFVWVKNMGGAGSSPLCEGHGVVSDLLGNVYTTGKYRSTVDFNPGGGTSNLTSNGNWDVFVQKLSSAGTLIGAKGFGSTGWDSGKAIDIDASGNVYVTGDFSETVNFDPWGTTNLSSAGSTDIFIQKLDASLNTLMDLTKMGGSGIDEVKSIYVGNTGSVLSTGFFSSTADFGTWLTSSGNREIFVHKLSDPTLAPTVVASQPDIALCCPDAPLDLGVAYIPTGNVYSTNNLFTPVNGIPNSPIGGEFVNLPNCVTTNDVGNDRHYQFDPCLCGPGIYPIIYSYTDSCGNSGSDTMTITVDGPTVTFSTLSIDLCNYSWPVPINPVSNGVSCQVTGPFVTASGEFDALLAGVGTHEVQISCQSANGCITTITGTIEVSANQASLPIIHIAPYIPACVGQPVVLSATNNQNVTMTWTDGNNNYVGTSGNGTSVTVSPMVPTTYTVTTGNAPCVSTSQVTVVPVLGPQVQMNSITLCESSPPYVFFSAPLIDFSNGQVVVYGLSPDAQNALGYESPPWPNVNVNFDPTQVGPGTYYVNVCNTTPTDSCCTTVTFIVIPNAPLNLPATACNGDAPFFMHPMYYLNGVTGITYSGDISGINLATNEFDPSQAQLGVNNFTACYLSASGIPCCQDYSITVNASPVAISNSFSLCESDEVDFFQVQFFPFSLGYVNVSGTTPAADQAINITTTPPGPVTFSFDATGLLPGDYEVNICNNLPGNQCCTTVTFTVCAQPLVTIIGANSCDITSPLTVVVSNASSTCSPTYSWSGPPFTVSSDGTTITPSAPGTYIVNVTTVGSCSASAGIVIGGNQIVIDPIVVNQNPCVGQGPLNLSASATGGTGALSFAWDLDGDGQFNDAIGQSVISTTGYSGNYCVQVTDANGCELISCIQVIYQVAPTITVSGPSAGTVCFGDNIALIASSANMCSSTTWQWYIGNNPMIGQTGTTLVVTAVNYPVGTVISVEACCFDCCSTVAATTVIGGPDVALEPLPKVNLCDPNIGSTIQLVGTSTGNNCVYGGIGVDPATGIIDLTQIPGPGSYPMTYTCDLNGCSTTVTQYLFVEGLDFWHQTTKNTLGKESANDVITDSQGNVYTVGTFYGGTVFNGGANPDITISSTVDPANPNTFISKYDECGNLLWVANTVQAKFCEGTSITLDEVNDVVYIGGNYTSFVRFMSSQSATSLCTSGYMANIFSPSSILDQGYVAQYDAVTGCLHFVETVSVSHRTGISSLTINETNGDVFIGGEYANVGASTGSEAAYVRKYTPLITSPSTSNSLLANVWSYNATFNNGTFGRVNDINYDETSNKLYMIGDFRKYIQFSMGGASSTLFSGSSISDAFVGTIEDLPVPSISQLNAGLEGMAGTSSIWLTGEGISVDAGTGDVYFTGNFRGTVDNPFLLASVGASPIVGAGQSSAYMIGVINGGALAWTKTAVPQSSGGTFGKDVVAFHNRAYFLGEFVQSNSIASGFSSTAGPYSGASGRRLSVIGYSNLGAPLWMNVTKVSQSTSTDDHRGIAIEDNRNGHSFVVGNYQREMGYLSGTPSSGNLFSTGLGYNAFVMRVDQGSSGQFKSNIHDAVFVETSKHESNFSISAIPNPTNSRTTILINGTDDQSVKQLKLVNLSGQVILERTINSNKVELDLTDYEQGVYIIYITDEGSSVFTRLMKVD